MEFAEFIPALIIASILLGIAVIAVKEQDRSGEMISELMVYVLFGTPLLYVVVKLVKLFWYL